MAMGAVSINSGKSNKIRQVEDGRKAETPMMPNNHSNEQKYRWERQETNSINKAECARLRLGGEKESSRVWNREQKMNLLDESQDKKIRIQTSSMKGKSS